MRTVTILALIIAASSLSAGGAKAERYWPWCARYGWSTICSYATFQQCEASVSGAGGYCTQNVEGPPVAVYAPRKHKRRHRH